MVIAMQDQTASDLAQICSSVHSDMARDHVYLAAADAKPDLILQCQAWQHANLMSLPSLRCTYCKHHSHMFKAVCDADPNSSKDYVFEVDMNTTD